MKAKSITFYSPNEIDTETFHKAMTFISGLAEKVDILIPSSKHTIHWNVMLKDVSGSEGHRGYFAAHIHVVGSAKSPGFYVSSESYAVSLGQVDIRFNPDTGEMWAGANSAEEIAAQLNRIIYSC